MQDFSFVPGQPITIVHVNGMAATSAARVIFERYGVKPNNYGPPAQTIIWKETKRKKQAYQTVIDSETLVFAGHVAAPFADSDTNMFMGNACLNLIGYPKELRTLIAEHNQNPAFTAFGKVTYRLPDGRPEEANMLYQEQAEELAPRHASVSRILNRP